MIWKGQIFVKEESRPAADHFYRGRRGESEEWEITVVGITTAAAAPIFHHSVCRRSCSCLAERKLEDSVVYKLYLLHVGRASWEQARYEELQEWELLPNDGCCAFSDDPNVARIRGSISKWIQHELTSYCTRLHAENIIQFLSFIQVKLSMPGHL